jgi:predicted dithiol-disulfide oxidoreductase (DUF899 family)
MHGDNTMATHVRGTRQEWLAARLELLAAEKALTRRSDELARQREELPWVRIDKAYRFETDAGSASLADLFGGRSQLLVYHFMFGADYAAGCASCSAIADGFNGSVTHLASHDVTLMAVSRAPSHEAGGVQAADGLGISLGAAEYNYRRGGHAMVAAQAPEPVIQNAAMAGADVAAYVRERPGMNAFMCEDDVIYHTYSTYARGLDSLWGMYQWLDRAPRGRNETGVWWRHHDSYEQR